MKYDYLIVGAGLYGAVFAQQAVAHGKTVLVIDKRDHIGGNIYCEKIENINDKETIKISNFLLKLIIPPPITDLSMRYEILNIQKVPEKIGDFKIILMIIFIRLSVTYNFFSVKGCTVFTTCATNNSNYFGYLFFA